MKIAIHFREDDKLSHVANVDYRGESGSYAADVAALDYAWEHTQNIDSSWSRDDQNVEVLVPLPVHHGQVYGLRSSMVGDVFVIEGAAYRVGSFGFDRLEEVA